MRRVGMQRSAACQPEKRKVYVLRVHDINQLVPLHRRDWTMVPQRLRGGLLGHADACKDAPLSRASASADSKTNRARRHARPTR